MTSKIPTVKTLKKTSGRARLEQTRRDAWQRSFSKLAAFKKRHGHCCPPRRVASLCALVRWIDKQRREYKQGLLDYQREQCLERIGFCWDFRDDQWEAHFANLLAFKKKHGHASPPTSKKGLGYWVSELRKEKTQKRLDPERKRRLKAIGFVWKTRTVTWKTRYAELAAFKKRHGHCYVSRRKVPLELVNWVDKQRQLFSRGMLSPEHRQLLSKLGFCQNCADERWEMYFAQLLAFRSKHGHASPTKESGLLGAWVGAQRKLRAQGRLNRERKRRLDQLGFSWNPMTDAWEASFAELLAFKKKHGHANPPQAAGTLGTWVSTQRIAKSKGLICRKRARRLNAIGFSWDAIAEVWERRFAELKAFKKKYGHVNPPLRLKPLGTWVDTQRQVKADGRLLPERERKLNAIGFAWNVLDATWENHFAQLVAFKKEHGHVRPAQGTGTLSTWIGRQRQAKAKGKLDSERERRLRALGFSWGPQMDAWERQFTELAAFKKKHGHTNPTTKTKLLYQWVGRQRLAKANGRLSPEQRRRLDKLGFVWKVSRRLSSRPSSTKAAIKTSSGQHR